MSRIAVFFNDPGFDDYPFDDPAYREAYEALGTHVLGNGAEFFLARDPSTYLGDDLFSKGWKYLGGGRYEEIQDFLHVDLIYNKGSKLVTDSTSNVVNKREFDLLASDKQRTYALFPHLFPKTFVAKDKASATEALAQMRSDMVVLKPVDGWGGKSVWIGPKADAGKFFEPYPLLVREFIDTSGGVPGVTAGKHDFRVILMNGEVLLTYARVPSEGKYVSNVGKGGSVIPVPPAKRPGAAIELARSVDARFASYGNRLYSVDCGLDKDGTWKIIEINDQPGLSPRSDCDDGADAYYEALARFLLSCVKTR